MTVSQLISDESSMTKWGDPHYQLDETGVGYFSCIKLSGHLLLYLS